MLSASDLSAFILNLDRALKSPSAFKRMGRDIVGFVTKNSKLSAYAETFCVG